MPSLRLCLASIRPSRATCLRPRVPRSPAGATHSNQWTLPATEPLPLPTAQSPRPADRPAGCQPPRPTRSLRSTPWRRLGHSPHPEGAESRGQGTPHQAPTNRVPRLPLWLRVVPPHRKGEGRSSMRRLRTVVESPSSEDSGAGGGEDEHGCEGAGTGRAVSAPGTPAAGEPPLRRGATMGDLSEHISRALHRLSLGL
jgi:hypothetical protein